jgi:hypothetical protein
MKWSVIYENRRENNHSVPLFNENNVNNFQKITKELTYRHMFRLVRFTSSFMKIHSVRTAATCPPLSADRGGPD